MANPETPDEDYWFDNMTITKMGQYTTGKELHLLTSFLGNSRMRCLDIGAGSGRFGIPLQENGQEIFSVDYDIIPLKKFHKMKADIPLCQADAQKLPFQGGKFDCLICIEVIDYLDIDIFLLECKRVLDPNGILLLSCSNKKSYKALLRLIFKKIRGEKLYPEFYRFSYDELKQKIENSGFTIEKATGYNWPPAGRASKSRLIPLYIYMERLLGLECLPQISPWVFFVARKKGNS